MVKCSSDSMGKCTVNFPLVSLEIKVELSMKCDMLKGHLTVKMICLGQGQIFCLIHPVRSFESISLKFM